nr:RecName: Full=Alpha-amylase 4; AltName: Full=1,4-alpha-D-glucan glucanohydrolase [Capsicum chinense]
TDVGFDGWR